MVPKVPGTNVVLLSLHQHRLARIWYLWYLVPMLFCRPDAGAGAGAGAAESSIYARLVEDLVGVEVVLVKLLIVALAPSYS